MEVVTTTERIAKTLTYTESEILRNLAKVLPSSGGEVVLSQLTKHRSNAIVLFGKLTAAGVIETRSLGMKGTYIRVLHPEAFQDLVRRVS